MKKTSTQIFRGFAAATAVALLFALVACSSGAPNADETLGVGTGTGSTGTTTGTTGGNGNTGDTNYAQISGNNTQPITVFDENFIYGYANEPMVSVEVCQPGTTTCETIPDVLLDTGSYGLRLIASTVSLNLPAVTSNGNTVAECTEFASAFDWGPVVQGDVKLADASTAHTASSVPIQLMGSSTYDAVPTSCSNSGLIETDTVATFGANGVLGVGVFTQDCGPECANTSTDSFYYSCTNGTTCTQSTLASTSQVVNPVALMPSDNNGVIVSLPSIATSGAISVSGTLVLGIGTEANNGLGGAQQFKTDDNGFFTVNYGGTAYAGSFLDTGSDAIYALNPTLLGIAACTSGTAGYGYYCPAAYNDVSFTTTGTNGTTSTTLSFSVDNATILANTGNAVFNDLAGPYSNVGSSEAFDLGLPFFLGRNVYVGFEGLSGGVGTDQGMYWAY